MNDQDEIRSIENPDCYFRFHLNKNTRINDRQRKAFNGSCPSSNLIPLLTLV